MEVDMSFVARSFSLPPAPPPSSTPLPDCRFELESVYQQCSCSEYCVVVVVLTTPVLFLVLGAAYCLTRNTLLRRLCPVADDPEPSVADLHERDERERKALVAIQSLPSHICGDAFAGEDCSLCMEPYVQGQVVRQLSCGHVYHVVCIDRWLMRGQRHHVARRCPLCGSNPLADSSECDGPSPRAEGEGGGSANPQCPPATIASLTIGRRGSEGAVGRRVLGVPARRHSEPGGGLVGGGGSSLVGGVMMYPAWWSRWSDGRKWATLL